VVAVAVQIRQGPHGEWEVREVAGTPAPAQVEAREAQIPEVVVELLVLIVQQMVATAALVL
jgi:hypothetical protein